VVAVEVTRQWVIDVLTRVGFTEAAEDARRVLPETIDRERLADWAQKWGITLDELRSAMGGSP
jgi:hypothetical protein